MAKDKKSARKWVLVQCIVERWELTLLFIERGLTAVFEKVRSPYQMTMTSLHTNTRRSRGAKGILLQYKRNESARCPFHHHSRR